MKLLQQTCLTLALALGAATTAQAAAFICPYILPDQPDMSGSYEVDNATDEVDAMNQTIAWIYETHGPVALQVKCYPKP